MDVAGTGLRGYVSYGANRGDGVSKTRRLIGEKEELGTDCVDGVGWACLRRTIVSRVLIGRYLDPSLPTCQAT
jgi:hypothetical protein